MEKRYFALDIGGTKTKYALLNEAGEILSSYEKDTEAEKGGSFILENVKAEIRRILEERKDEFKVEALLSGDSGVQGMQVEGRDRKNIFNSLRGGK